MKSVDKLALYRKVLNREITREQLCELTGMKLAYVEELFKKDEAELRNLFDVFAAWLNEDIERLEAGDRLGGITGRWFSKLVLRWDLPRPRSEEHEARRAASAAFDMRMSAKRLEALRYISGELKFTGEDEAHDRSLRRIVEALLIDHCDPPIKYKELRKQSPGERVKVAAQIRESLES